jgi:hypothetical protein
MNKTFHAAGGGLNEPFLQQLRKEINEALAPVADRNDVKFLLKTFRIDGNKFTVTLETTSSAKDPVAEEKMKDLFELYGLPREAAGMVIKTSKGLATITHVDPKRPKFSIWATINATGKAVGMPEDYVIRLLKLSPPTGQIIRTDSAKRLSLDNLPAKVEAASTRLVRMPMPTSRGYLRFEQGLPDAFAAFIRRFAGSSLNMNGKLTNLGTLTWKSTAHAHPTISVGDFKVTYGTAYVMVAYGSKKVQFVYVKEYPEQEVLNRLNSLLQ